MWPLDIANDEAIVRGICSPFHVSSKGKLKPEAYESPADKDEVSVIRLVWAGANTCKRKAKELEDPRKNKVYTGLAVLSAKHIRDEGADVFDSRNVYSGHADIKYGVTQRKGVPLPPEVLKQLRSRHKNLASTSEYYPDAFPKLDDWQGPPLTYKGQSTTSST
jgi:hypothetical protein